MMEQKKIIDIYAPIEPGVGLGGVRLGTHLIEYYELVTSFSWLDNKTLIDASVSLYSPFHIGYEKKDTLIMIFDVLNGKLQRICALTSVA